MNKEICTICKKNIATWCYMPGYATLPGEKKPSPYECDDCVHRGCTCNYRYVDINSYYPPLDNPDMPEGIEGKDWKWIEKDICWCVIDDRGREFPCCEYDYSEDGYDEDVYDED